MRYRFSLARKVANSKFCRPASVPAGNVWISAWMPTLPGIIPAKYRIFRMFGRPLEALTWNTTATGAICSEVATSVNPHSRLLAKMAPSSTLTSRKWTCNRSCWLKLILAGNVDFLPDRSCSPQCRLECRCSIWERRFFSRIRTSFGRWSNKPAGVRPPNWSFRSMADRYNPATPSISQEQTTNGLSQLVGKNRLNYETA